jgi:hypothetical protein
MFRELGEAYTLLDDDPALRVGVLHAFGDKHGFFGMRVICAHLSDNFAAGWGPA